MKFCKECKWYAPTTVGSLGKCAYPTRLDPESGDPDEYCFSERRGFSLRRCGRLAIHFEAKTEN